VDANDLIRKDPEVVLKRFFLLSIAALGFSSLSSAAVISCVINQATVPINSTSAGATVSCGGVSAATVAANGAGSYISSIVLTVKGTFNDSAITPAYFGLLNFAFNEQSSEFTIATIAGNAPLGGIASDTGSTGNLQGFTSGLNLAALASFNVNVLETLISGGRLPESSNVTVTYDYTVSSGIPEPSTYAMMGLGFSALAFFGRRLKR